MHKKSGFTIVEIIVVTITLGILVTVGVVSYNNVRTGSVDRIRAGEQQDWLKRFESFRNRNVIYPNVANGDYCLGTGFANARCKYTTASGIPETPNTLVAELGKLGAIGSYPHSAVGTLVGPWATYTSTYIRIYHVYAGSCPNTTTQDTSYTGAQVCYIQLTKN